MSLPACCLVSHLRGRERCNNNLATMLGKNGWGGRASNMQQTTSSETWALGSRPKHHSNAQQDRLVQGWPRPSELRP
eukprot:3548472-Alexandrium_andersonii.AAC.1